MISPFQRLPKLFKLIGLSFIDSAEYIAVHIRSLLYSVFLSSMTTRLQSLMVAFADPPPFPHRFIQQLPKLFQSIGLSYVNSTQYLAGYIPNLLQSVSVSSDCKIVHLNRYFCGSATIVTITIIFLTGTKVNPIDWIIIRQPISLRCGSYSKFTILFIEDSIPISPDKLASFAHHALRDREDADL